MTEKTKHKADRDGGEHGGRRHNSDFSRVLRGPHYWISVKTKDGRVVRIPVEGKRRKAAGKTKASKATVRSFKGTQGRDVEYRSPAAKGQGGAVRPGAAGPKRGMSLETRLENARNRINFRKSQAEQTLRSSRSDKTKQKVRERIARLDRRDKPIRERWTAEANARIARDKAKHETLKRRLSWFDTPGAVVERSGVRLTNTGEKTLVKAGVTATILKDSAGKEHTMTWFEAQTPRGGGYSQPHRVIAKSPERLAKAAALRAQRAARAVSGVKAAGRGTPERHVEASRLRERRLALFAEARKARERARGNEQQVGRLYSSQDKAEAPVFRIQAKMFERAARRKSSTLAAREAFREVKGYAGEHNARQNEIWGRHQSKNWRASPATHVGSVDSRFMAAQRRLREIDEKAGSKFRWAYGDKSDRSTAAAYLKKQRAARLAAR